MERAFGSFCNVASMRETRSADHASGRDSLGAGVDVMRKSARIVGLTSACGGRASAISITVMPKDQMSVGVPGQAAWVGKRERRCLEAKRAVRHGWWWRTVSSRLDELRRHPKWSANHRRTLGMVCDRRRNAQVAEFDATRRTTQEDVSGLDVTVQYVALDMQVDEPTYNRRCHTCQLILGERCTSDT